MIDPGTFLEFSYPTRTHVREFPAAPRRRRKLAVHRVRDLVREPLTVDEFLRRPFTMRSRWLVIGQDADLGQWRQFYLGSAEEFRSPGGLRVALYEPRGTRPREILTREFAPTVADRKAMVRTLMQWSEKDYGKYQLRICCDDLRLVS